MKNALVIVTFSALLSACAGGPLQPQNNQADAAASPAAQEASTTSGSAPRKVRVKARTQSTPEDQLPTATVTEDVMVKYLSAEIAEQRGNWQAAYVAMLSIAQQSRDPRIAKRAVEIALNAKKADEALAAVRLWRELAPQSDEAAQYYLGFIMLSDNIAEAKPFLQQRLKEVRPQVLGPTILQLQRLLVRAKDKAAALALFEEVLAPYQALPETHIALAQSAFAQGDNERAVREARSALAIAPASELAALNLAQVLTDKNEAVKALATFLSSNPKSREVRLAYARLLVEEKRFEPARAEFKTLLKEQPKDATVLYALGLLGAQSNDRKEAETYLTTYLDVLAADPDDERDPTQALLLLSQIAEERNDTQAALKWLDRIDSSSSQAYLGAQIKRAHLLAKSGDIPGARKLLHEVKVDDQEDQIQLILGEATILRTVNESQQALELLDGAMKRFPDNADVLYEYAMTAEKLDKVDLMETALRKVMKIAPDNQHAYNALGYSLAERNIRLDEANTLIEKALQLAPQDPFIMDSMGWVQYRLGKLREAESILRRAYELRPDPEIGVHLGEVLWVKGQQEDAKKLWRDANIKDPKNDTLKSTLARLQVKL